MEDKVSPLLGWFQRKGLPACLAMLLTPVILIIVLLAGIGYIEVAINQLANAVPKYVQELDISTYHLDAFLTRFGIDSSGITDQEFLKPENLTGIVGGALAAIATSLSNAALAILVFVFMLLETSNFPSKLKAGINVEDSRFSQLNVINRDVREYVKITTYTGMLNGLANALLLMVLGVDFPILWGVLAWMMSYTPSLGFWIALIPPALLALLEHGWQRALIVAVGYILINGGVENLLKPRVMQRGLNLSALVTVISVFFWGWVLGPIGALLAIPLTMVVQKLILEPYEGTRWLADVMGSGQASETVEDQDSLAINLLLSSACTQRASRKTG